MQFLEEIPGVSTIEHVLTQLEDLVKEVTDAAGVLTSGHLLTILEHLAQDVGTGISLLGGIAHADFDWIRNHTTGTIFSGLLREGLGVDPDKVEREAPGSVSTIETLLGFCLIVPVAFSSITAIARFWLGQRFPETIARALGAIPEEMGMNWAIGMFMDRAVEAAIGNKFEEAIQRQKRPNAPDWRVVRLMLKQHMIPESLLDERLAAMGFSDEWIHHLKNIGEALLPVGDIQQMYLYGFLDKFQIMSKLDQLGFRKTDQDLLYRLYIEKADTQAGRELRNVGRELYRAQIMDEQTYRNILDQTHMPEKEVDADLLAIKLEHEFGRIRTPVSAIKAEFQHGHMEPNQAVQSLQLLGYTAQAAQDQVKVWSEPRLPHPMTAAKVLTYYYSGVLTDPADALNRLIATGLRPQDAQFLLDHPTAGAAKKHRLTPALVTQAYMDDVIQQSDLESAMEKTGLQGEALIYAVQVAMFRKSRMRRPASGEIPLDKGEILEAFKFGIYSADLALTELEKLGYSADSAQILLEIKDKGGNPFAKGVAAPFASLADALAYLAAHGYTIHAPPDPMLIAAEAMASAAGYTYAPGPGGIATLPPPIPPGAGPTFPSPLPGPFGP